jgi:hypothetical protein
LITRKFHNGNILRIVAMFGIVPYLLGQRTSRKGVKPVELTKIAGNCKDGDCPTIYRTDRGTVAVQGYRLDLATPETEAVVEIPDELLAEAARALGG